MVFHFNKKHLEDETIPMWVVKTHGETFYVNHVECTLPWSTKETPDNTRTKGSIKIKECLLAIDDENCAHIQKLTIFDKVRLRNQKLGITRIMFGGRGFEETLKQENVRFSPFKRVHGACGTAYTVCDLLEKEQVTWMTLKYAGRFRILQPNEPQYQAYDDKKLWEKMQRDYENSEYSDDEDDDE